MSDALHEGIFVVHVRFRVVGSKHLRAKIHLLNLFRELLFFFFEGGSKFKLFHVPDGKN